MSQLPGPRRPARPWWHWPALGGWVGLLVLLGQFQELVFAALARAERALKLPGTAPGGLSQHGLPSSLAYHLLYAGASIGALHVLLRGRGTRRVVLGFGGALLLGAGLVAAGRPGAGPAVATQGHALLDFASSPLALLAGYALATFGRPGAARPA